MCATRLGKVHGIRPKVINRLKVSFLYIGILAHQIPDLVIDTLQMCDECTLSAIQWCDGGLQDTSIKINEQGVDPTNTI